MDDIIILHEDKNELWKVLEEIDLFLKFDLKLQLNNKTQIRPISTGIDFVGFRIWPTHRKLRKSTTQKMRKRLKWLRKAYARNVVDLENVTPVMASYLGMMKHASCYLLRKKILKDFILRRE
jgi:hypothetical protein